MKKITMNPIGFIHSPYHEYPNMPIQGIFRKETEGWIELEKKYTYGLEDLDGFSHAIILYYFHMSHRVNITGKPFLEDREHGIFAIRGPNRPNHIGLSIVKIRRIEENRLYFGQVDMLDGTPVLDIKPYIKYFDHRENVVNGWVDKHFDKGNLPARTIL